MTIPLIIDLIELYIVTTLWWIENHLKLWEDIGHLVSVISIYAVRFSLSNAFVRKEGDVVCVSSRPYTEHVHVLFLGGAGLSLVSSPSYISHQQYVINQYVSNCS